MNNIRNGKQVPEPAAMSGSTESFCYHDRLLPPGWYVKIDKKQVAENSRLHSFSQDPITVEDQYTDFYYKHFGETFGHQPPEPDKLMPWRDQLSEINQQLAPTFTLASRQASVPQDPIVESRAATTETQGEMSYGGASKLGPAVDAAGGSTKTKASKKYKSRQELVEENIMLKCKENVKLWRKKIGNSDRSSLLKF